MKSDRLEGVYKLSFLLLSFELAYLFVRKIVDNGFLAAPSAICFSILWRDHKLVALFIIPLPFLFVISFNLVPLHSREIIPSGIVLLIHFSILLLMFVCSTYVLFEIALNPLLGVVAGIVVMIIALKILSYVMTNLVIAEEVSKLRESRRGHDQKSDSSLCMSISSVSNSTATSAKPPLQKRSSVVGRSNAHTKNVSPANTGSESSSLEKKFPTQDEIDVLTSSQSKHKSHGVKYPRNVTLNNIGYSVVAPTLVYETGKPRSERVCARYVTWHGAQILDLLFVEYVLLMQFCVPV